MTTFRPMRRIRQQLTPEETADILRRGEYGVLAVLGDGGYPYAVPLNYVYLDGRVLFHCARSGHKLDAIRRSDRVSFCVVDRADVIPDALTTHFRSAIVFGRARVLEDDGEIRAAARALGLRYNPDADKVEREIDREWRALACVEIRVEHMTGKEAIELTRQRNDRTQGG